MQTVPNEKIEHILACVDARGTHDTPTAKEKIDLECLAHYAISPGGFLNADVRKKVWPILVSASSSAPEKQRAESCHHLSEQETDIIQRDVGRSVWHTRTISLGLHEESYENEAKINEDSKINEESKINEDSKEPFEEKYPVSNAALVKKQILSDVITSVLESSHGQLCYYQGFHDVASLFIINLQNPTLASEVLSQVSFTHFRDAMKNNFQCLSAAIHLVLFPLLEQLDPELHDFLVVDAQMQPIFALSWILAWFSHDVKDLEVVSRLFDFFIVSHPLMPFYMSAAVLIQTANREKILSTDCDFEPLHQVLSSLPKDILSSSNPRVVEELIGLASAIIRKIPPQQLIGIAKSYQDGMLEPFLKDASSISYLGEFSPPWSKVGPGVSRRKKSRRRRMAMYAFITIVVLVAIALQLLNTDELESPSSSENIEIEKEDSFAENDLDTIPLATRKIENIIRAVSDKNFAKEVGRGYRWSKKDTPKEATTTETKKEITNMRTSISEYYLKLLDKVSTIKQFDEEDSLGGTDSGEF